MFRFDLLTSQRVENICKQNDYCHLLRQRKKLFNEIKFSFSRVLNIRETRVDYTKDLQLRQYGRVVFAFFFSPPANHNLVLIRYSKLKC